MMNIKRRNFVRAATAGALMQGIWREALAQAGVETAVIVVGFAPGGVSDAICRRVATSLAPGYARTAVVDNRTGAGGQIAVTYVKGRPADGATVLLTPSGILTIYPHIYKKLPYDPVADLTPVSIGATFEFGFAVGPAVPASVKTPAEFLAWAKANPDGANFASGAAGSAPHFVGAMLGKLNGVELRHAAYRGTQPALADMFGGSISAVSAPLGEFIAHLGSPRMRILGVTGSKRSRFLPQTPTFQEQGVQNMVHSECSAFFMPPNASPAVVSRLNAAMRGVLTSREVVDSLASFGLEASPSSPAELADLVKTETVKWAPIVKAVGFTAEG